MIIKYSVSRQLVNNFKILEYPNICYNKHTSCNSKFAMSCCFDICEVNASINVI